MVIIRPPGWSERSELSNIWPLMPSRIMWNRLLGVERTVSAAESTKLRTHFQKPELPATKTNYNRAKVKLLPRIRNTATECFPGRVANDKIGASLGESSQRVPPTASERGVHVFFAGPRQVMAKSITKDIVQCLPNNSKLTCRFVLYLLLPGSLRLLRSTSLPGALVLGITSVLRPKWCTVVISSILDVDAYVHTMPKRVVCKETAGSSTAHDESCPYSRTLEISTHQDRTTC